MAAPGGPSASGGAVPLTSSSTFVPSPVISLVQPSAYLTRIAPSAFFRRSSTMIFCFLLSLPALAFGEVVSKPSRTTDALSATYSAPTAAAAAAPELPAASAPFSESLTSTPACGVSSSIMPSYVTMPPRFRLSSAAEATSQCLASATSMITWNVQDPPSAWSVARMTSFFAASIIACTAAGLSSSPISSSTEESTPALLAQRYRARRRDVPPASTNSPDLWIG